MRVTEIIRGILDLIDGIENQSAQTPDPRSTAYSDRDIKRFRQIVDIADNEDIQQYANRPNEQYASVDAVTVNAGTDNLTGVKNPRDIRAEHPQLYPTPTGMK